MVYTSAGEIQTSVAPAPKHSYHLKMEGQKNFYLWGSYPKEHKVKIDEHLSDGGLISAAAVRVHEYQTFWNSFLSIISLGMYVPITYRISAYGKKRGYINE